MINKKRKLIILSIPFQRLVRSHLSPLVLSAATNNAHILIVSPFSDNKEFRDSFCGENIAHINVVKDSSPFLSNKLKLFCTILRTHGFWLKNRKYIPYYWENRHNIFKKDFQVTRISLYKRIFFNNLALIGLIIPKFERVIESIFGKYIYHTKGLQQFVDQFEGGITLIQASSWGDQDQILAFVARKKKWRTVLLPYTTDQLFCNGYLYCEYDAVCVQGEYEASFALNIHKVSDAKVIKAGSAYLRALEAIKPMPRLVDGLHKQNFTIMYAGLASEFFPVELEIEVLNRLIFLKYENSNIDIIYRPVSRLFSHTDFIKSQLIEKDFVKFQIPTTTSLGLHNYEHTDSFSDLKVLLGGFCNVDILITSLSTSLSIEAAFLGIPSISYYPLENSSMKRRHVELMLNTDGRIIGFESIPVCISINSLIIEIKEMQADSNYKKEVVESTMRAWDYADADFIGKLEAVL